MIEATDLDVFIGNKRIVTGASFEARPGEFVSIVGPNGSGKTTLMRALCGDLGFSGEITFSGRSMSALKPWQLAGIRAVLPQAASLSFPFTVREVVKLGLTGGRSGVLPGEAARLPERALAKVDLEGFAGRFYQELSGGEQQRVQLSRVLCQVWAPVLEGNPRFLLLDEPVSSLDIKHQLVIMRIAREFADRGGGTVAILHDLNLASMFSDRIYVMHRGRIAASGAPGEVLQDDLISRVFECGMKVGVPAPMGMPYVLPQTATIAP